MNDPHRIHTQEIAAHGAAAAIDTADGQHDTDLIRGTHRYAANGANQQDALIIQRGALKTAAHMIHSGRTHLAATLLDSLADRDAPTIDAELYANPDSGTWYRTPQDAAIGRCRTITADTEPVDTAAIEAACRAIQHLTNMLHEALGDGPDTEAMALKLLLDDAHTHAENIRAAVGYGE